MDLIYYKKDYQLFVLVQYKLMREENDYMVYRPDWQLYKEMKRMDEFAGKYRLSEQLKSHVDYRLNDDGFLVKLVPNNGLRPASGELIKGMYLTREYIKFLLGPDGPRGKCGGQLISFDNAPRYLTNTEFTKTVNRGFLGTRGLHTKALKDLIQQHYETGRAVLVAYERPKSTLEQTELFPSSSSNVRQQLLLDEPKE